MRHNPIDEGQRAALRRLRRAQLAEARRIRRIAASAYRLTPAHLAAPCRVAPLAEARQVAMYLMRTRLTWPTLGRDVPFPSARIGALLGGRDHSTVLHGVGAIAARLTGSRQEDAYLRRMVGALTSALDAAYEGEEALHRRAA
jgi:chromosomal replication initiation ATPase DnaA